MCEVCHMTPCHPRCPNSPEPPAVYHCKVCGEPIVAGETYYEMDCEFYHEECFEDRLTPEGQRFFRYSSSRTWHCLSARR